VNVPDWIDVIWFSTVYTVSLNIAWLREYFDPIFVPELDLKDSTNTASSASYLEHQISIRKVQSQILGNHFFSQIVLFSNDPPSLSFFFGYSSRYEAELAVFVESQRNYFKHSELSVLNVLDLALYPKHLSNCHSPVIIQTKLIYQ
jgi:hypothetical protein